MQTVMNTAAARAAAFSVPVPQATRTYGPVANAELHAAVTQRLNQRGFSITNEQWDFSQKGQIALCVMHLGANDKHNLKRTFAFMNSYNKMRRLSMASGAVVSVCSNGMFWGDEAVFQRKHHRNIWNQIMVAIDEQVDTMEDNYKKLTRFKEASEFDMIGHDKIAQLMGKMYLSGLLTPRMLSTLKKEMSDSENFAFEVTDDGKFRVNSMWRFYNNCTEALKRAPAHEYVKRHTDLTKTLIHARGYSLN